MTSTIGQKLRHIREEQERTLEEVAYTTHINLRYVKAMEEDNFEILPSPVQQRGFLRSYAGFLGIDPAPLLMELASGKRQFSEKDTLSKEPQVEKTKPSQGKLEDIGEKLKIQREVLGFSLEDVDRQIHVNPRYLQALEEGRFDDLPSLVQGRGMLKNYADFLALDAETLLLFFAEELQTRLEEKRLKTKKQIGPSDVEFKRPSWARRVLSPNVIVSTLFALVLVIVIIWASVQVLGQRTEKALTSPTIPGVAEMLLPSATPSPTLTPSLIPQTGILVDANDTSPLSPEEEMEIEVTPLPAEEGAIRVQLVISQRAWVQVTVDGNVQFSGRMLPGSIHVFDGDEQIEVLTGNAAGVRAFYNQQEIGALGIFGGVANLIFTTEGIFTPTPTTTPTPTITPTPAVTLTPTPTLTPND